MSSGKSASILRRRQWVHRLKRSLKHPYTKLAVGIILVFTSTVEIVHDLTEDIPRSTIGAHHGLLILGIVNALSAIPELVEGLDYTLELAARSDEYDTPDE
jgi:hypothetical protein